MDFRRETGEASVTMQLAEKLFIELVVRQHADAATPSETRTAVSCLLLEQICAVFSRYHSVLSLAAETIMRSVYVPNTLEMRDLLGATSAPLKSLPPTLGDEARELLKPYHRKTFFRAYEEVSDALARFARSNRSIEIRLSRQTKVFDQTMRHWMASIQRNVFSAWRSYTKRRFQLRAKYRAVFYRVRSDECKVKAIRRWRERAARIRKAAMLDAANADEMQALTVSVQHMQGQIDTLSEYNENLGKQIKEQDARCQQLQAGIDERERLISDMQGRAAEVERLGTELLDSVLFAKLPPAGSSPLEVMVRWAHGVIEATGGTVDGTSDPLAPLLTDEYLVELPLSPLGCLMMGFQTDRAPTREAVVQLHLDVDSAPGRVVAMCERLTQRPCIVTEEQVASGQRGVLLLFVAGLLRYAGQWLLCPQPAPAGENAVPLPGGRAAPWSERIAAQRQWILAGFAAQNAALVVAVQHPVALSFEEAEDQRFFLDVPANHVADLLPLHGADRRHLEIMKTLRKHYVDVRNLYLAYATPVMTFADLLRMLKDCRMFGERKLSKRQLESICRAAWRSTVTAKPEDGIGSLEVSKAQFTEILLRVSHAELKRAAAAADVELLPQHVAVTIAERLAAHALRSDVDKFKQVVRHPHVQVLLARHKVSLRRVFHMFANCDEGEGMNRIGFQQLARDCGWIIRSVSIEAINDVFRRVQNVDAGSVESLDFTEWLECLCAMAVYHNPNPFTAMAVKLEQFIEDRVLCALS